MSTPRFEIVRCGVDDLTLGFDMTGSGCIGRLNELDGIPTRRGKMLGGKGMWTGFVHLLGRSVAFWRQETSRLYVQAKLAEDGELCPLDQMGDAMQALCERMALLGIVSYEPPWVTRVDVAVDGQCRPEHGKLLLDALEGCRPPNGWRTQSVGVPRSTVYFKARASEDVKARAYCRNLKTKTGEPFGLIRLEAEQRYEPKERMLDALLAPGALAEVWLSRYGSLSKRVARLPREQQLLAFARLVEAGALRPSEGERMSAFLDLERMGIATTFYPPSLLSARKREAASLGLAANEIGTESILVDLQNVIRPYVEAVEAACGGLAGLRGLAA